MNVIVDELKRLISEDTDYEPLTFGERPNGMFIIKLYIPNCGSSMSVEERKNQGTVMGSIDIRDGLFVVGPSIRQCYEASHIPLCDPDFFNKIIDLVNDM